jgi:hypothetical protein
MDLPQLHGLPQRVLRRSLICVRHFRQELSSLRSAYAEREDLAGLRTLVEAMSAVVAETEREVIVRSRKLYEDIEAGEETEAEIKRFCGIVGGLVNSLEGVFPQLMQICRQPPGREIEALIPPFTDLLSYLYEEDPRSIEVVFEPGDEYAFELSVLDRLTEISLNFKPQLRGVLSNMPQVIAITYPEQLEAETLGHGIIAHEIAHTVLDWTVPPHHVEAPILDAFETAAYEHSDAVAAAVEEEQREQVEAAGGKPAPRPEEMPAAEAAADRAEDSIQRMRRWFEEMACDALALGMIGPAYVFALADLDLATNRWRQLQGAPGYETHPGLSWRLRHLIGLARNNFFHAEKRGPAVTELLKALEDLEADLPDEADEILDQERALVEAALAHLAESQAINRVLGRARYLEASFAIETELVREKLVSGIPPAERVSQRGQRDRSKAGLSKVPEEWSTTMKWQSLLNGGYAFWLEGGPLSNGEDDHRVVPDRRGITRDWIEFNSYIRGSIELANLHTQLVEARGRLDGLNPPGRG